MTGLGGGSHTTGPSPTPMRELGGADPVARSVAAMVQDRLFAAAAPPRFGRFVLLGHIGQGGMGVVFMAYDPQLDRNVALKLQRTEGSDDRQTRRAQREAQALARLAHPNIVPVFEAGEQDGKFYLAMELVRGRTLDAWRREHPEADWRAVLDVLLQAGEGLAAAHGAGVVHREHKPAPCNPASQPDAPSISKDLAGLQGAGLPRVAPRCPALPRSVAKIWQRIHRAPHRWPVAALALLAACSTASEPDSLASASLASPASRGPSATPLVPPRPEPNCPRSAAGPSIEQLQGRWRVRSSSGQADQGHVFRALIGEIVTIAGDRLHADGNGRPAAATITKLVRLSPCTAPQAIDLEQPSDAKGWSRVGIIELMNDVLTLSVTFPQEPRPTDFAPVDDDREVVVLDRL